MLGNIVNVPLPCLIRMRENSQKCKDFVIIGYLKGFWLDWVRTEGTLGSWMNTKWVWVLWDGEWSKIAEGRGKAMPRTAESWSFLSTKTHVETLLAYLIHGRFWYRTWETVPGCICAADSEQKSGPGSHQEQVWICWGWAHCSFTWLQARGRATLAVLAERILYKDL